MRMTIFISMLLIGSTVIGCRRKEDGSETKLSEVGEKVGAAADKAIEKAREMRDEFVDKMSTELDNFQPEIDKLKAKIKDASGDAKVELQKALDTLDETSTVAREKLVEMREKAPEKWKDFRDEVDKSVQDAKDAYEAAKKELEAKQ